LMEIVWLKLDDLAKIRLSLTYKYVMNVLYRRA